MKEYRALWKKPHLVAAAMAGAAGVLAAVALAIALLGPGAPTAADSAVGQVQSGPVEGCTAADHQNDRNTLSFRLDASPQFRADGTSGGLYLENPRENCYDLQVDIELEDGTVVYSSPVLKPDSHIDFVALSTTLEEGI